MLPELKSNRVHWNIYPVMAFIYSVCLYEFSRETELIGCGYIYTEKGIY